MSTYITRPFSTCHKLAFLSSSPRDIRKQILLCSTLQKESLALPFISSLALLASSSEANFTKPNPLGLLVTLSVMTVAAIKHDAPVWVITSGRTMINRSLLLQVTRTDLLTLGRTARKPPLGCFQLQNETGLQRDRWIQTRLQKGERNNSPKWHCTKVPTAQFQ
jgi:hypothetical protein